MAQLFTVHFPKYYFDLQKEFELELTQPLPFEYVIEDGNCYVSAIRGDNPDGDIRFWQNKGLQPGLRLISMNGKSLIDDYNIEDEDGNIDNILNEDAIEDLLANADTEKCIKIEFREEVSPQDYSIPLGLGIDQETLITMRTNREIEEKEKDNNEEEKKSATQQNDIQALRISPPSQQHSIMPSTSIQGNVASGVKNLFEKIEDGQIGASSFEPGYEPSKCRLNYDGYWQPSGHDQTTLDTWLRIDLGMKKMITKLHVQGLFSLQTFCF